MNLVIIFLVTFSVRMFGVMVGGNRNILLPLLMVMGLPASESLATFKTGGLSSFLTLIKFHKNGQVKWKIGMYLIPLVTLGTIIGSIIVINIDQELFKKIISISVLISLIIFLLRQKIKIPTFKIKNNFLIYVLAVVGGFLGGCIGFRGLFLRYIYMGSGLTFIEAAATKKVTGLLGNIASVITFVLAGLINWPIAITMFIAGGLGSWLGVSLGIKIGNVWLEKIFAIVIFVGIIRIFL